MVGHNTWVFDQPSVDPKRAVAIGMPFPQIGVYSFGCTIVDTLTDEATGKTWVDEAWSAMDVGRAINPSSVEGQIEGGFGQGMGFALYEEMVWDGGRLANPTLLDYKVPTALDTPYRLHSIIVEAPEPDGPFGAKGGLAPVACPRRCTALSRRLGRDGFPASAGPGRGLRVRPRCRRRAGSAAGAGGLRPSGRELCLGRAGRALGEGRGRTLDRYVNDQTKPNGPKRPQ